MGQISGGGGSTPATYPQSTQSAGTNAMGALNSIFQAFGGGGQQRGGAGGGLPSSSFTKNFNLFGGLSGGPKVVGYGPDGTPHDEWGNPIKTMGSMFSREGLKNIGANFGIGGPDGTSFGSVISSQGVSTALMAGGTSLAMAGLTGDPRERGKPRL